jgi:hypothetical protein
MSANSIGLLNTAGARQEALSWDDTYIEDMPDVACMQKPLLDVNRRTQQAGTPFLVTFKMGSPIALSKFGMPRLESLLRHRQMVTGGQADDVLPLAMHDCGILSAGGVFTTSHAVAYNATSITNGHSIFKTLISMGVSVRESEHIVAHGHLRMKGMGSVISALQNWRILPSSILFARGVGDPRAVLEILERDPFIGIGTNLGYGEVLQFSVEECDWEDEKDEKDEKDENGGQHPTSAPWVFLDKRKRLTMPLPDTTVGAEIAQISKGMITKGSACFQYPFRTGSAQMAFLPVFQ